LERVSKRLAAIYATQIQGETLEERMQSLASLFTTRRIPLEVERRDQLPVLHVHACPYPELAEQDAGICAMEKLLFAELLGERMKLDECRLDGARCCTFQRGEN
jgi:predicted ArsR family transcriptional regulator